MGEAGKLYQSSLGDSRLDALSDRFWLLTSLAEVEFERQEYVRSERWLRQAEQAIDGLAANAPERVRLLNAWGALHLVRGNFRAAERQLSRSVQFGDAVPEDRAAALHDLAAVEMHLRRLPEAVAHETQALGIWRARLGDRHYYVMKAWISLSSAQGLLGDWTAAEESLRQALAIGASDEALGNYVVVLDTLKRGKEAKSIRQRLGGSRSPLPGVVDVKSLASGKPGLECSSR
jgi:tetratricopeptide (TPR) repeat protein